MINLQTLCIFLSTVSYAVSSAPNIIWLQADSMDGRLLDPTSPYWNKVAMPNLKKLATQGTFFKLRNVQISSQF